MTVLHENQLTHTDLKPENILFVNSDADIIYNPQKVGLSAAVGDSCVHLSSLTVLLCCCTLCYKRAFCWCGGHVSGRPCDVDDMCGRPCDVVDMCLAVPV